LWAGCGKRQESLFGPNDEAGASELLALKRRIAELLVECKANPLPGEPAAALAAHVLSTLL